MKNKEEENHAPPEQQLGLREAEDEIMNQKNNMIVYRDPQDVRTIFQLLSLLLVFLSLLVMSAAGNAYQYWRRPDRIVVDRSNGRVLMINDRQFGETESVKMTPDVPNNEDKKYVVQEYVRALYAVNPAIRAAQIKTALEMMVPKSATIFAGYLKDHHILEQQRAESWQAVWTPQDMTIDRADPFTVRVIGRQEITKIINNQAVQESKQLQLTVKLAADPAGRTEQNRRMGFLVAAIDYKEITS
jgi:hypothetical protein